MSDTDSTLAIRARAGLRWVALGLCVCLAWSLWVASRGAKSFDASKQAALAGDFDRQILELGRAARARLPVYGGYLVAQRELMDIGESELAKGHAGRQRALRAFRELRRAILATRTFEVSDPVALRVANRHIARLMAEIASEGSGDVDEGSLEMELLEKLDEIPEGPSRDRLWAAMSFVLWIFVVYRFIRAFGQHNPPVARWKIMLWAIASLTLLYAWQDAMASLPQSRSF